MIKELESNQDNSSRTTRRLKEKKKRNSKSPKSRSSKHQGSEIIAGEAIEFGKCNSMKFDVKEPRSKKVLKASYKEATEGEEKSDFSTYPVFSGNGFHQNSYREVASINEQGVQNERLQETKRFSTHHVSSRFGQGKVTALLDKSLTHTLQSTVQMNYSHTCLEEVQNQITKISLDRRHDSFGDSEVTSPAGLMLHPNASCLTSHGALDTENNFFDDFASFAGASLSTASFQGGSIASWEKLENGKTGTYLEPLSHEILISYMLSSGVSTKNAELLASAYSSQEIEHHTMPRMNLFKSSHKSHLKLESPLSIYDSGHTPSEEQNGHGARQFSTLYSQNSQSDSDQSISKSGQKDLERNDIGSTQTLITSNVQSITEQEAKSRIFNKHRRCCFMFAAGILLIFVTALSTYLITSLFKSHVIINSNSSYISGIASMNISEEIVDAVTALMGQELAYNSPQFHAVAWLSRADNFHHYLSNGSLAQRFTMATLYFSLNGDQWFNTENWMNPKAHECDWSARIKCQMDSLDDGVIIEIDMTHNFLKGELPPELGLLSRLEKLLLSKNMITGTIPSEIFSIQALKELDISSNSIQSKLPENLGQAQNMHRIMLYQNQLQGTLSSNISKLSHLYILDLHSNGFTGTLPETLSSLTLLNTLDLRNNYFSGSIPMFGSDMSIDFLHLDFNNFSGVIPLAYKDLMQSLEITISHNHITGSVPLTDFDEIQLMSLDLSHNLLTGLPLSNLESISSLRYLDVSNNNLSGLIKQRNKRSSLEFVSYANNKLTGVLPSLFDEKLVHYDISGNNFTGNLSSQFCKFSNLEVLQLFQNSLTGIIPSCLLKLKHLRILNISNNNMMWHT